MRIMRAPYEARLRHCASFSIIYRFVILKTGIFLTYMYMYVLTCSDSGLSIYGFNCFVCENEFIMTLPKIKEFKQSRNSTI